MTNCRLSVQWKGGGHQDPSPTFEEIYPRRVRLVALASHYTTQQPRSATPGLMLCCFVPYSGLNRCHRHWPGQGSQAGRQSSQIRATHMYVGRAQVVHSRRIPGATWDLVLTYMVG